MVNEGLSVVVPQRDGQGYSILGDTMQVRLKLSLCFAIIKLI